MIRRAANFVAVLSLVLLVVVAGLWVQSYRRGWQVVRRDASAGDGWHRHASLACFSGQFSLTRSRLHAPGADVETGWSLEGRQHRPMYDMDGGVGGIQHRVVSAQGRWLSEIRVPIWPVAVALAAPPAVVGLRRRRLRVLAAAGRCPACGYDVRATPGRCPECGLAIANG